MSNERDLEPILFFYQFKPCEKDASVYYSRLDDTNFMVMRMFGDHTIDLVHERYVKGEDPCSDEPVEVNSIKRSFEPNEDESILKEFYRHWKSEVK